MLTSSLILTLNVSIRLRATPAASGVAKAAIIAGEIIAALMRSLWVQRAATTGAPDSSSASFFSFSAS